MTLIDSIQVVYSSIAFLFFVASFSSSFHIFMDSWPCAVFPVPLAGHPFRARSGGFMDQAEVGPNEANDSERWR